MRKRFFFLLSLGYLASAMLGWTVAKWAADDNDGVTEPLASERVRKSPVRTGKELVQDWGRMRERQNQETRAGTYNDSLAKMRAELPPAEDPAKAFQEASAELERFAEVWAAWQKNRLVNDMERPDVRPIHVLAARWQQLFDVSPEEALAELKPRSPDLRPWDIAWFNIIGEEHFNKVGWKKALEDFKDTDFRLETATFRRAVDEVGKGGMIQEVRELQALTKNNPKFRDYDLISLGKTWDLARKDELISVMEGEVAGKIALEFLSRIEGREGIEWIRTLVAEEKLSPEGLAVIAGSSLDLAGKRGLTLDERFEVAKELGGNFPADTKNLKTGLVTAGVIDFLEHDDDWAYRFRHGQASPSEIFEAAKEHVGEVADHDKEFRSQLFRHLAEEDPERAMDLYAGTSAEGQNWQKIYAARWWFSEVNPNEYLKLMESIDFTWGQDEIQQSLWAGWQGKSALNISRFGENYLRWIEQMPDGVHKGRALQTYIHEGEKNNPELGARARATLTEMQKGKTE